MAAPANKGVLHVKKNTDTWQTKGSETDQVGWLRSECAYSPNTLIGNWNEKRFDVSLLSQAKPLPSQFNHYFETTYTDSFSKTPQTVPEVLKFSRAPWLPMAEDQEMQQEIHSRARQFEQGYS